MMNFRYTNLFLAALLCGVGAIARAQLPFFENFDAMRADSYDWNSQGRLLAGEFDYGDDEAPPKVRGPRDGVTPYSGNRMFEMRASVYKNRERTMRLGVGSIASGTSPGVEYSLWFNVPSTFSHANRMLMEAQGSAVRTGRFLFDFATNKFEYKSLTIQDHSTSFSFTVPRDQWNHVRIRYTWGDNIIRSYFNETPLLQVPFEQSMFASLGGFRFGVIPLQDTSAQFVPFDGAPGYYVDDVGLKSVPEVSQIVVLGAGIMICVGCRSRRRIRG